MNICICTIIKNELEEYLDDFINYHLNLGIDHFFFFEDTDSLSHEHILAKYPSEQVTLLNIGTILDDHLIYTTSMYKNLAHGVYYRKALWYVKKHYEAVYDWCFATDIDEYITLRNTETSSENIKKLLMSYNDYDAIWLHWQNFNANGHIHKPDYSKKGIVYTYTQPCGSFSNSDVTTNSKFVYNLNRYQKHFLLNQHRIHHSCKYFESDILYLRHYIMKSWEEFVWKLKIRGTFSKKHRSIDDFFLLNPDLEPKKNELIELMNQIIHKNEK
jgi:hypothetical protein